MDLKELNIFFIDCQMPDIFIQNLIILIVEKAKFKYLFRGN